jgi:hypothetical protein
MKVIAACTGKANPNPCPLVNMKNTPDAIEVELSAPSRDEIVGLLRKDAGKHLVFNDTAGNRVGVILEPFAYELLMKQAELGRVSMRIEGLRAAAQSTATNAPAPARRAGFGIRKMQPGEPKALDTPAINIIIPAVAQPKAPQLCILSALMNSLATFVPSPSPKKRHPAA